jgi:hypothetical protein
MLIRANSSYSNRHILLFPFNLSFSSSVQHPAVSQIIGCLVPNSTLAAALLYWSTASVVPSRTRRGSLKSRAIPSLPHSTRAEGTASLSPPLATPSSCCESTYSDYKSAPALTASSRPAPEPFLDSSLSIETRRSLQCAENREFSPTTVTSRHCRQSPSSLHHSPITSQLSIFNRK